MRTLKDIKRNAHIQKELLLSAIDAVNSRSANGGYIVYSTCSVSIEENEEVINYALKNRKVKVVDTGISIGEPGIPKFKGKIFHPSMTKCKRIYPHVYNMEGFFIAKLRKLENDLPELASKPHSGEKREKKYKIRKIEEENEKDEELERKIQKQKKIVSKIEEKKRLENGKKNEISDRKEENGQELVIKNISEVTKKESLQVTKKKKKDTEKSHEKGEETKKKETKIKEAEKSEKVKEKKTKGAESLNIELPKKRSVKHKKPTEKKAKVVDE